MHNDFLPSAKLEEKSSARARDKRRNDKPPTPCERLLGGPNVAASKAKLRAQRAAAEYAATALLFDLLTSPVQVCSPPHTTPSLCGVSLLLTSLEYHPRAPDWIFSPVRSTSRPNPRVVLHPAPIAAKSTALITRTRIRPTDCMS